MILPINNPIGRFMEYCGQAQSWVDTESFSDIVSSSLFLRIHASFL